MVRKILCRECGTKPWLTSDDVVAGWKQRKVGGKAKKPARHGITIKEGPTLESLETVSHEELATIVCDNCGKALPDGTDVIALTQWRPNREPEPREWEPEFMEKG